MSEPLVPHADLLLARDQHSPQSIVYRAIDELLRHRAPACECADRPAWCSAISGCTPTPDSPRLDSQEVREALEFAAGLAEVRADNEAFLGRPVAAEIAARHARTLRAMADGVASDADARDAGRWVPVTERLPSEPGRYTVTCKWKDGQVEVLDDLFFGSGGWELLTQSLVLAWMPMRPLPPPYTQPSTAEKGE